MSSDNYTPGQKTLAAGALALSCVLWGWSFPTMQIGADALGHALPDVPDLALRFSFLGQRFLLAALLYFALTFRGQFGYSRTDWKAGLSTGVCYTLGLLCQLVGLRYTLPSISGFLTAMCVVLVPIAQSWIGKRPVGARIWVAVVLALVGGIVMGWPSGEQKTLTTPPFPGFGELLTVLGSFAFTGQILFLDRFGAKAKPVRITLLCFACTAVMCLGTCAVFCLAWPRAFEANSSSGILATWNNQTYLWTMFTLVVFSSIGAFHLMNKFQPYLAPAVAGVIYCLEPVFAALFSLLLGQESERPELYIGGGLVLVACVLTTIKPTEPRNEPAQ